MSAVQARLPDGTSLVFHNMDELIAYTAGVDFVAASIGWTRDDLASDELAAYLSRVHVRAALKTSLFSSERSNVPRLEHCWREGFRAGLRRYLLES